LEISAPREARLASLDALIARGLADAGRTRPGSDVFDRLEARLAVQTDGK